MKDDLGNRFKENYEKRARTNLLRRVPVVIRVDGKNFHTFCKRFSRPYDHTFNQTLNNVMQFLCQNIQGAKFAERHSDEISIIVTDYDTNQTDAFFDYNTQKICSIVSSMATAEFCRILASISFKPRHFGDWIEKEFLGWDEAWPNFDARCFNIPENEISNYVWWRMLDAKRNSISMLAQSKFSHKELQGKNSNEMQEMLFSVHGINWNNVYQGQKIGFICKKDSIDKPIPAGPNKGETVKRNVWTVTESPCLKSDLDNIIGSINLVKDKDCEIVKTI